MTGKILPLTDRNGPDHSAVISPDGKTVAYLGYDDKVQTYQINHLYLMNVDGTNKREVSMNLDRNIGRIKWNAKGTGLYCQYDDRGDTKIGLIDLDGQVKVFTEGVGGTTIGRPYGGGSYSVSNKGVITFTACTSARPADIGLINVGKPMARLTDLNADLLNYRNLGEVEEVWYPSSFDQRQIQGWVVKPPNFDPNRKYPLLVENHGGPVSNYGARFSPEIQLYASAGYVVFYPNPRGSTSYGKNLAICCTTITRDKIMTM